jgi:hypothetical protein
MEVTYNFSPYAETFCLNRVDKRRAILAVLGAKSGNLLNPPNFFGH